jgi:hypothetical protein
MANATIYDIPAHEAERIKREVVNKIREMDAAELAIKQRAHSSFAEFLTQIAYEVAGLLGYAIAIPIAWAENILEGVTVGLVDGFERGIDEQRAHPRRRR